MKNSSKQTVHEPKPQAAEVPKDPAPPIQTPDEQAAALKALLTPGDNNGFDRATGCILPRL